jgi:hypothetical protein
MNRSLEALAIFAICLGGMLAVVRFSAQDRSVESRNVAEGTSKAIPPKTSGTTAEPPPSDECQLAYDAGCGFDRHENLAYAPNRPLLSPRQVAQLAILSPPIPLLVLPAEPEQLTGYDAAYDAAMFPAEASEAELSRAQIEAEYAAAELAAAKAGAGVGTFSESELIAASPVWNLLSNSLNQFRADCAAKTTHLQQSYVAPFSRAIVNRWSQSELPRMMRQPRAKAESRDNLLHRQRAGTESNDRISWDDYLTFSSRVLPVRLPAASEPRMAEQKRPRNVLWPR